MTTTERQEEALRKLVEQAEAWGLYEPPADGQSRIAALEERVRQLEVCVGYIRREMK